MTNPGTMTWLQIASGIGKHSIMPSSKGGLLERDGKLMLTQLHEMKKKENEMAKDFDEMFDRLLRDFPNNLKPSDGAILLHYANVFEGQFGFLLKDKSPTTLEMEKEFASKIEENLLSSKVEPFNTSRASSSKSESKKGVVNATEPTPI
jgi:hypothetical protein